MDVLKGILGIVLFGAFFILLIMFMSWLTGARIGQKYGRGTVADPDDLPNAIKFLSRKGKDLFNKLSPSAKQKVMESINENPENNVLHLERLFRLRREGVLSEEEFEVLKSEIIQRIKTESQRKKSANP